MEREKRPVEVSREGGGVLLLAIILAAFWLTLFGIALTRSISSSAAVLSHPPMNSN